MRFTIRSLLTCLFVCGIIAALIGARLYRQHRSDAEFYQCLVSLLVCDYLDENQQEWPKNWEGLEPFFNKSVYSDELQFDELQDFVDLDFTIVGADLLDISEDLPRAKRFNPVRPAGSKFGGPGYNYYRDNPNSLILNHVNEDYCNGLFGYPEN